MIIKILGFLLDTPESYWVVIRGYHFKKAFWGCFLASVGIIFWILEISVWQAFVVAGLILVFLSIAGNIHTGFKPRICLWEKTG